MERSGRSPKGSITGFYTVLVEGDDMNEPISDAVRGILDGHIVLSRRLAHRGHYPAIDILESISRLQSEIVSDDGLLASRRLRQCLAVFRDKEELVSIGAYVPGADPELDKARNVMPDLNNILVQNMKDPTPYDETMRMVMDAAGKSRQEVQVQRRPPPPSSPPAMRR